MTTKLLIPETWAWDDYDMFDMEDRRVKAAAEGAELLARQRDKITESLAYNTCDSVHLDDE